MPLELYYLTFVMAIAYPAKMDFYIIIYCRDCGDTGDVSFYFVVAIVDPAEMCFYIEAIAEIAKLPEIFSFTLSRRVRT